MKIFKIFSKFAKKYIGNLVLIVLISFVLNYIRSLVPLFIGKAVSVVGGTDTSTSTLPQFILNIFDGKDIPSQMLIVFIGIIVTCALREGVNICSDILIAATSENIGFAVQTSFFKHIQLLPYSYLNKAETGDLIQRATNDTNRVKRFLGDAFPEILSNILKLLIYSTQMILIDWRIGLAIIAFIPVILTIGIIHFNHMGPIYNEFEEDEGKYSTVVQENLTGIRVVQSFANEDLEIEKQNKTINKFMVSWDKMMNKTTSYWALGDIFSYGMLIVGFVLGVIFIRDGSIGLGQVTSLLLFAEYVMWPTRQLGRQITQLGRTDTASSRILEICNMKTEYELSDGDKTPEIHGDIVFNDVSYSFEGANIPVLSHLNFSIKAGETVAIVGKTGCGKSTLVSLINRMSEPTSGVITLDGVNLSEINKKYLRKNIGLVLQEPFLFSATIAENIGIVENEIDLNAVKKVSDIAAISEDIERFENGYDTIVGERGVTLSGGQKQRISIARMLIKEKPILVFDDSLSAVDTETDRKIRNALHERQDSATTIIITHRIITAKDADKIIVLKDGGISNIGTHEELIKQPGLYKDIWDIQNYFEKDGE